ncbi:HAD-IIIC family phosphatase [Chengkuizengella sp. YPA3-1-1]|uniref:HAD-IIIC family phosphatase n=2 Tax=Chengkuizengella marina TaxID=2507566 RepID=A0A6N9Q882_9BACL|nr:HAD-IIIC family phosphatase [Chengkuizengella marina]
MTVKQQTKKIKCVVWDLDNTVWQGVLLEDKQVVLREKIKDMMNSLDERGILQSIASKNDWDKAMTKLEQLGIKDLFLYPQIGWNSKSESIKTISESLNIGLDTIAFIDDDPYERDEVVFTHKEVRCIDATETDNLLDRSDMNPEFITEESKRRRSMYLAEVDRKLAESDFKGPKDSFLKELEMKLIISDAKEEDLKRAEELTMRTNQLNTTGVTYSYDELDQLRKSDDFMLLVVELNDKYGSYGKIGLSLIEMKGDKWNIKLLLMSCRVMSRGVGTILINHIMMLAKQNKKRLFAQFVPNGRNRQMYITYKFAGFKDVSKSGDLIAMESDLANIQQFPDYVEVDIV